MPELGHGFEKRWRLKSFALIVTALTSSSLHARHVAKEDGPANAASQSVADEAQRILTSIKSTEYKHKTDIDESKGSYYCDCSGFVGYVLNRTVAKEDPKGPLGDGKNRPLARDYANAFAAAPTKADGAEGWLQIARLADARPGDIIAWRKEKPKPGNTGHVVIVAERPIVEEDGLVRVVMIDSTTNPQFNDTRAKGTSGIGRGTMWFAVDAEGRPHAHIRGSRKAKPIVESISIGRALPQAEKPAARRAA